MATNLSGREERQHLGLKSGLGGLALTVGNGQRDFRRHTHPEQHSRSFLAGWTRLSSSLFSTYLVTCGWSHWNTQSVTLDQPWSMHYLNNRERRVPAPFKPLYDIWIGGHRHQLLCWGRSQKQFPHHRAEIKVWKERINKREISPRHIANKKTGGELIQTETIRDICREG